MATPFKANRIAKHLREALLLRLGSAWECDESLDASNNPVLTLRKTADGAWTTAEEYAVIRVKPIDPITTTDTFGLAVETHTPHIVQLITETSAAAGIGFMSAATVAKILAEIFKVGSKTEVYLSATTVKPTTTLMAAAQLVAEIWPEPRHQLLAAQ